MRLTDMQKVKGGTRDASARRYYKAEYDKSHGHRRGSKSGLSASKPSASEDFRLCNSGAGGGAPPPEEVASWNAKPLDDGLRTCISYSDPASRESDKSRDGARRATGTEGSIADIAGTDDVGCGDGNRKPSAECMGEDKGMSEGEY